MYKQGDIILMPFPYSDLTGSKKRPAIIISNSRLKGDDFICALITSNTPKEGLLIKKDSFENGTLPFQSWIKPQRIFTIDKKIIIKKLANINNTFYKKLEQGIFNYIKKE
ncbi:MAG: type II toxin-antitoxin system PemK/MazF family toxin [Nanoarchaeota archaeon]|jgi:mRNA interferase MazF|nr:type II toxin-antitoxin system PemK/MazF family toxin [Nanoarchaeota archaeon]